MSLYDILIVIVLSLCVVSAHDNICPVGCDTIVSATTQFNSTSNSYVFVSSFSSQTITYIVPLSSNELLTGRLRVTAKIQNSTYSAQFTPISGAGPAYSTTGGTVLQPATLASLATFNRTHEIVNNTIVVITYNITYLGNRSQLKYTLQLTGQTLIIDTEDSLFNTNSTYNFFGWKIGSTGTDLSAAQIISIPYLPEPVVFANNAVFFCAFVDKLLSNGYSWTRYGSEAYAPTNVTAYTGINYAVDSKGKQEPLKERSYLTVSLNDVGPILPRIRNPISQYRSTLSYRPVLDLWSCSGFATENVDAVRCWTSTISGQISIVANMSDTNPNGGDGVSASIKLNKDTVFYTEIDNGGWTLTNVNLTVSVGDLIYFAIGQKTNNGYDSTNWPIVIVNSTGATIASAYADWSTTGVYNYKNWTFWQYSVSTGYLPLNWTGSSWTGTAPYLTVGRTSFHPSSVTGSLFQCFKGWLKELEIFNVVDLYVIIHAWQRFGYDVKLPNHYPAGDEYGGDEDMRDLMSYATKKHVVALHHNFADLYPDAPSYNASWRSYNADMSPKLGWYNQGSGTQAYLIAAENTLTAANAEVPLIRANYKPNAPYEDVDTATPVTRFINLDGSVSNIRRTLWWATERRREYFKLLENSYQGAVSGEGSWGANRMDCYNAGYVNVEAEIEGGASSLTLPEFALREVMPKQANQGMGYASRFLTPINTNLEIPGNFYPTVQDEDFYRVQQILYGHTSWISLGSYWQWGRSTPAGLITEYYMMKSLQSRYLNSQVTKIEYSDERGAWNELAEALRQNVNLYRPRVRVLYNDSLQIVADARYYKGRYEYPSQQMKTKQGSLNWYFQYAPIGTSNYINMTYSDSLNYWVGPGSYLQITDSSMHPNANGDPVLSWVAPVSCNISVTFYYYRSSLAGDGTNVSVWQDNNILWNYLIFNSTSYYGTSLNLTMSQGQALRFRTNMVGNNNNDACALSAYITYEDPTGISVPWNYTISANKNITLQSPSWVAFDPTGYLCYSALQSDNAKVDYCKASNYTFARSRDNAVRNIENIVTDGTFALVDNHFENFTNIVPRSLYVLYATQVLVSSRTVFNSSSRTYFGLSYSSPFTLVLTVDKLSSQITINYFDFPAVWYKQSVLNSSTIIVSRGLFVLPTQLTADAKGIVLSALSADVLTVTLTNCPDGTESCFVPPTPSPTPSRTPSRSPPSFSPSRFSSPSPSKAPSKSDKNMDNGFLAIVIAAPVGGVALVSVAGLLLWKKMNRKPEESVGVELAATHTN